MKEGTSKYNILTETFRGTMNQKITLIMGVFYGIEEREEGHLKKGGRHMLIIYLSSTNHVSSLVPLAPSTYICAPSPFFPFFLHLTTHIERLSHLFCSSLEASSASEGNHKQP
jgi:hypothetical protein